MGTKIPATDHNGREYPCLGDMCAAYGVPPSTYRNRLGRGWTQEQALETPTGGAGPKIRFRKPVKDHTGREFPCVREMAEAWGINEKIYWSRLRLLKWPLEKILTEPVMRSSAANAKSVTDHEGAVWPSVSGMCRHWKIGLSTYRERIRRGYDTERALTEKAKSVNDMAPKACRDHKGRKYPSLNAMCRAWGLTRYCYQSRLDLGWDMARALEAPMSDPAKPCRDWTGREFPSMLHMANFLGLPAYALQGALPEPEDLPGLVAKYWSGRACGKFEVLSCPGFPWFLAEYCGRKAVVHIGKILDEYHGKEMDPFPDSRVPPGAPVPVRPVSFPWYLADLGGRPVLVDYWRLIAREGQPAAPERALPRGFQKETDAAPAGADAASRKKQRR